MARQIGKHYQEPSIAALEERLRMLEDRVTALADVVRVLAHGLEDLPAAGSRQRPAAAAAARQAYDLLLVAEPRAPGAPAGTGDTRT